MFVITTFVLTVLSAGLDEARLKAHPRAPLQGSSIPADAYGMFENRNDPSFQKVLLVEKNQITVTTTITVNGRKMPNPLTCRSASLARISGAMTISLTCMGERIPYKLTNRPSSQSWVVSEDGATPEVFSRR